MFVGKARRIPLDWPNRACPSLENATASEDHRVNAWIFAPQETLIKISNQQDRGEERKRELRADDERNCRFSCRACAMLAPAPITEPCAALSHVASETGEGGRIVHRY